MPCHTSRRTRWKRNVDTTFVKLAPWTGAYISCIRCLSLSVQGRERVALHRDACRVVLHSVARHAHSTRSCLSRTMVCWLAGRLVGWWPMSVINHPPISINSIDRSIDPPSNKVTDWTNQSTNALRPHRDTHVFKWKSQQSHCHDDQHPTTASTDRLVVTTPHPTQPLFVMTMRLP